MEENRNPGTKRGFMRRTFTSKDKAAHSGSDTKYIPQAIRRALTTKDKTRGNDPDGVSYPQVLERALTTKDESQSKILDTVSAPQAMQLSNSTDLGDEDPIIFAPADKDLEAAQLQEIHPASNLAYDPKAGGPTRTESLSYRRSFHPRQINSGPELSDTGNITNTDTTHLNSVDSKSSNSKSTNPKSTKWKYIKWENIKWKNIKRENIKSSINCWKHITVVKEFSVRTEAMTEDFGTKSAKKIGESEWRKLEYEAVVSSNAKLPDY